MVDPRRISSPGTIAAIMLALAGSTARAVPTRGFAIVCYVALTLVCLAITAPASTVEDRGGRAVRQVLQLVQDIAVLQSRDLSTIERRAVLG